MATYAIGDIQGCFATFERLLERIDFAPGRDQLWLVGDLVNRGPRSVDVVRWCVEHQESVVAVLGNHDVHVLGVAFGLRDWRGRDSAADVVDAPDRKRLIDWLVHRPFLHKVGDTAMVHAGLWHGWTIDDARAEAAEVERALRADPKRFLRKLFEKKTRSFEPGLAGGRRRRAAAAVFTRLRVCDRQGRPDYEFSGAPGAEIGPERVPWFQVPGRRSTDSRVLFGHWSTLNLHRGDGVVALDTGCVWGRTLTAFRLEDEQVFQQPAIEGREASP